MQQLDLVIHNATGLHARPARVFVDLAKRYQSTIKIRYGEKYVNAKSLIAVLTLGVGNDQRIQVDVTGDDEEAAAAAIVEAVRDGLGEGPEGAAHHEPAAAAPTAAPPAAPTTPAPAAAPVAPTAATVPADGVVQGVAGAPGIAVGPVYRFERAQIQIIEEFRGLENEYERLQDALNAARTQLATLHAEVAARTDASEAAIFEVHREILSDPELIDDVRAAIADGKPAAEAWHKATSAQATELAELSDALLAERAADIRDVGQRVLRLLTGSDGGAPKLPDHPVIVVASDLTPSETAALDPKRVLGFCTAVGGPNAHTAILARALGLPAVVSAGQSVLQLAVGTMVVLDGGKGTLTVNPDEATMDTARKAQQHEQEQRAAAQQSATQPATTTDGHRVEIVANIGGVSDARKAGESGAEGVGLLRTEFLFLERNTAPSEDEQYQVYHDILEALNGHPVIARTLDIGGDKPLPYLNLPHEENPFLGERGIRLCLAHPNLLREQLRALLRAASAGKLRIMFPMIADVRELRAAKAMIDELRAELNAPAVEVGIMVEIPSAAVMADVLAEEVDFFSIGTNDLTQYTLAMDRTHPTLATQADGLHPAVLRLIGSVAKAAHAAGKWVGVCGELGADPVAVPILVGLGVDELSISVPSIPTVKAQIRELSLAACQQQAQRALACATAQEVRQGQNE